MKQEPKPPPPLVHVPLRPSLTPLIAFWCNAFDVLLIVSYATTNGRFPPLSKIIICTAVTITVSVYCLRTERKNKACRVAFRALVKEGLGRPAITDIQTATLVGMLAVFTYFGFWVFGLLGI